MVEKSLASGFWPTLYEPFRSFGTRLAEWVAPAAEASEKDGAYTIAMELPGVDEKDVEVTVEDGVVTVKGEKKTSREEKGETWYFSERQFGAFSRSFRLPTDADEAAVKADLKGGVLIVSVKKKAAGAVAKAKKVAIGKG
ncbi:MAG: glutamyl-tRNA amidotransferase [Alphaproteobacteria bacterium HGW-Alphaproteobacteria-4]|nr:MAG: glutamyl-tRNA amidotransferase [Alphaproteobacteria bacterium HGW-Alphaproteobacteria-4]